MHSQPPPKGSLEDLFRHHLAESEAAAVPPRPLVWDHIDNSLLLAQNEKYRRRLLVHRWSLAASLLLAALAGGGWWHSQQVATATLASTTERREAARRAVAGALSASSRTAATTENGTLATTSAETQHASGLSTVAAASPTASNLAASTSALARAGGAGGHSATAGIDNTSGLARRAHAGPAAGTLAYATTNQPSQAGRGANSAAGATTARTRSFSSPNGQLIAGTATLSFTDAQEALLPASQAKLSPEAAQADVAYAENTTAAAAAANRSGEGTLDARLAVLAMAPLAGLPKELAMKELPAPTPTLLRHWRYGAEYAISAFQPNIDFNRNATGYNPALGLNTVSLTRAAAAEYRANLRAGLGQRLTLRATRWLGGHWSLSTGVEVAQQEAHSATSAAFTGEQLADLNSLSVGTTYSGSTFTPSRDLHESSFRYRSAGVPLELQYDNQAKSGLSFYGRLGAIVSALLSVRSEVAGNPEATRTYTFTSASTPYRRLTALLRGSAGVRYRPAGRGWGLHVGPTAEAGVQSMNVETDRSFLQQSRPYSVGIEAGIEFGGGFKPLSPFTN